MALFATTGWAAAEVRNRTVAVAQIRVGSHGHGLQLIYGHVVHLTTFFFVCLLPLHSWNSHSADQLEVAGNCAMVSSLFLSSRSLCLCFNQDDWYAYAFDELLKDLIAIWQDLRWPGPYIAA